MTNKEMQQLQKSIQDCKDEIRVLKALRVNMLKELHKMGKAYDKIKEII